MTHDGKRRRARRAMPVGSGKRKRNCRSFRIVLVLPYPIADELARALQSIQTSSVTSEVRSFSSVRGASSHLVPHHTTSADLPHRGIFHTPSILWPTRTSTPPPPPSSTNAPSLLLALGEASDDTPRVCAQHEPLVPTQRNRRPPASGVASASGMTGARRVM